jgi:nucleoside triphosphatase
MVIQTKQIYPEPIVGALILKDKKVLLVKSWKWGNLYCIPGGHIELGENIEEAVKREIKEEIGLGIELEKVLFIQEAIYPKKFHKKKHFIFFECVCKAKSLKVRLDKDEIQEFIWIEPKKALKLTLNNFTRKFIRKYLEENNH